MSWAHATRNLSKASDTDLIAMRDAAKLLMDHQRRISPTVLTELCLIREETCLELRKRSQLLPEMALKRQDASPDLAN
jgi:hypothetical protein